MLPCQGCDAVYVCMCVVLDVVYTWVVMYTQGFFWASTWNMISAIVALCTISGPNKPGGLAAGMALSGMVLSTLWNMRTHT